MTTVTTENATVSAKSNAKGAKVNAKDVKQQYAAVSAMLAKDGLSMAGIEPHPIRGSMQFVGFVGWLNNADALQKAHAILAAFGKAERPAVSAYGWSNWYCAKDHAKRNKSLGKLSRYYACVCTGLTVGKYNGQTHKLDRLTPEAVKRAAIAIDGKAPVDSSQVAAKSAKVKATVEADRKRAKPATVTVRKASPAEQAHAQELADLTRQFGPEQAAKLLAAKHDGE